MDFKRFTLDEAEIKFTGSQGTFEGYASKFGGIDSYGDTIMPGAYADTIKSRERPIRMRWNHYGEVIGKWNQIKEDKVGLFVAGELTPGHSVAQDVYASMKHGAVDGLSIGYRVKDYSMDGNIRQLKKIDLVEISVVEDPADLGAKIGEVKHLIEMIEDITSFKEFEALLREAGGFSRASATALMSRAKALVLGERDTEEKVDFSQFIEGIKNLKV